MNVKPCPFCGKATQTVTYGERRPPPGILMWQFQWYVSCPQCHTEGPPCETRDMAIKKWNTREAVAI